MNTPKTEPQENLSALLEQRDQLIASEPEFKMLKGQDDIENEAIRELGEIVIESTAELTTFHAGT